MYIVNRAIWILFMHMQHIKAEMIKCKTNIEEKLWMSKFTLICDKQEQWILIPKVQCWRELASKWVKLVEMKQIIVHIMQSWWKNGENEKYSGIGNLFGTSTSENEIQYYWTQAWGETWNACIF